MPDFGSAWLKLLVLILSAGSAALCVGLVRWQALHTKILSQPVHRSLHTNPTPVGGGIAIIACWAVMIINLVTLGLE